MRKFDGFSSVAALPGQRRQRDGVSAHGDCLIGTDDAPIAQAETAGEIKAAGQGAKVGSGVEGGASEASIVVGAEAGEHGVGFVQGSGVGEA
jgi:hypothetical protein